MNDKLKPALIGGVALGILSAIPFVSSCCCLWALLGGLLATYLYVKNSPAPASVSDGAILGAMAGVIGVIIFLVVGIPVAYAMGPTSRELVFRMLENFDPAQAAKMRADMEASATSIVPFIIQGLVLGVVLFVFSVIGGLIGVPIFEKRKPGPPPPPNMGGGPGAYVP